MTVSELVAIIKGRSGPPESHFRLCRSGGFMFDDSVHVTSEMYSRVVQFFAGEERHEWQHD